MSDALCQLARAAPSPAAVPQAVVAGRRHGADWSSENALLRSTPEKDTLRWKCAAEIRSADNVRYRVRPRISGEKEKTVARRVFCILVASILAMTACSRTRMNSIQIKGSDTMVNLGQTWAEKYMEQNPGDFVAVTGGGSGTGLASLISGTCDIAMSSRIIKQKEIVLANKQGINPNEIVVALDGLAVVVNPANSIDRLTIDQLAGIFSGTITNWKDVGGADETIVILSREVNSGTHVYFKEHVLRKGDPRGTAEFAPGALMLSSSQAIADEVAGNRAAIGYYGMGYISKNQKPVSIARDENSPYIEPTIENVIAGTYPISRPLLLYTNGEPQGLIKKFVDFALSKEGQDIVLATDFVPVRK
jgi:phosphate transport system substrate-binding protein